jgi:hypothetical protein
MSIDSVLSRRRVLGSLVVSLAAASLLNSGNASFDADLIDLARDFEALADQIDHAIGGGSDMAWEVLHEFDRIESEIVATQAKTIDGLRVKARAASWALLGDLESADQSTTDKRMMVSIARDIMRLS